VTSVSARVAEEMGVRLGEKVIMNADPGEIDEFVSS
jgi:hypothetical protein